MIQTYSFLRMCWDCVQRMVVVTLKKMLGLFNRLDYEVNDFLLNARDFGVLQNRKRIILIGHKRELNVAIPDFLSKKRESYLVQSIFEDLPKIQAGEGLDKYFNYAKPYQ